MDWSEYFFRHVYLAAQKSKDDRTKIGAVLVRDNIIISEGFNGICRNVYDPMDKEVHESYKYRYEKPTKYFYLEHAERNSIYNCSRHGISTMGSTMFTQGTPCADCCRGLIQSGITKLVIHLQWPNLIHSPAWVESIKHSSLMLKESKVKVEIYDKILGIKGYLDGKEIEV